MQVTYSRQNPSPRYIELVEMYKQMHVEGEKTLNLPPEETFPGISLIPQVHRIKALVGSRGAATLLDYGSGKGMQYELGKVNVEGPSGTQTVNIQDYWDVDFIHCYDPAYEKFNKLPTDKFDGVVCTDVLEHCPEEDIDWIVDELFSYANKFMFAVAACYPAKKHLPNGENAHCTIKPVSWWKDLLDKTANKYPGITYEVWVQSVQATPAGNKLVEEKLTNA